jgi:hypothetical protein
VNNERKIEHLQAQIDQANDGNPEDFNLWREQTGVVLRNVLGEADPLSERFAAVRYSPQVYTSESTQSYFDAVRRGGVQEAIAILRAAILQVEMSGGAPDPVGAENS